MTPATALDLESARARVELNRGIVLGRLLAPEGDDGVGSARLVVEGIEMLARAVAELALAERDAS